MLIFRIVAPYPPLSATPTLPPLSNGTAVYTSMPLPPMVTPTLYDYPTGWLTAPTGVAPGTVLNGCYYYYQVQTGDNCTSVSQTYVRCVRQSNGADFYFYLRYGLSYQDFVTWNNNPSLPCPSLTPGSFVCVDVLNVTDTAPPAPTNAAPGSGPSVLIFPPIPCSNHSLDTKGLLRVVHDHGRRRLCISGNQFQSDSGPILGTEPGTLLQLH